MSKIRYLVNIDFYLWLVHARKRYFKMSTKYKKLCLAKYGLHLSIYIFHWYQWSRHQSMSVGGALISVALTIAALTSVVNSTDFSGTEHHRTDISEFRAPTLVALTIVALKSVALTSSHWCQWAVGTNFIVLSVSKVLSNERGQSRCHLAGEI